VQRDVRNGLVSIAGALRDYGVVIEPKRLTVDAAATQRRRRQKAAAVKTSAVNKRVPRKRKPVRKAAPK